MTVAVLSKQTNKILPYKQSCKKIFIAHTSFIILTHCDYYLHQIWKKKLYLAMKFFENYKSILYLCWLNKKSTGKLNLEKFHILIDAFWKKIFPLCSISV